MPENKITLHMLVGKIASGKSTLAARLGRAPHTIIVSEDEWLASLYSEEMKSLDDYVLYSVRLRATIEPHLICLLQAGISVVLDFHANTLISRQWMQTLIEQVGCSHKLHFLDLPDEICRSRMHARNARGEHVFAPTNKEFDLITSYFVAPTADEGFDIIVHSHI